MEHSCYANGRFTFTAIKDHFNPPRAGVTAGALYRNGGLNGQCSKSRQKLKTKVVRFPFTSMLTDCGTAIGW